MTIVGVAVALLFAAGVVAIVGLVQWLLTWSVLGALAFGLLTSSFWLLALGLILSEETEK